MNPRIPPPVNRPGRLPWSWLSLLLLLLLLTPACGGGGGGGTETPQTGDTNPPVVTAVPGGDTYTEPVSVTLSADESATIYYTTDGSTPTTSSETYQDPLAVSGDTTLRFFAVDDAGNESAVTTEQYAFEIPVTVSGQILFDDGVTPVEGATVTVSLSDEAARRAVRAAKRTFWEAGDYTRPDAKKKALERRRQGRSRVALRVFGTQSVSTNAQGNYQVTVTSNQLPIHVLVRVTHQPAGAPAIESARWQEVASAGGVTLSPIAIPNPEGRETARSGTTATTPDGTVEFSGLPSEIDRLFATTFDPGDQSGDTPGEQAFPGEFAELGQVPLNSSAYLWVEALDADGNPVSNLSDAVTIRAKIPKTQWADLEDITSGTDRIELPMYFYDEDSQMWEQGDTPGWLEAADGTVLPEDAQSEILDGSYDQDVYAVFTTTHFSWMNVDYAYIGPWTLSRLDRSKRNVDCLYEAMQLAKAVVRSQKGHDTYKQFNKADGDLDVELADGKGPELKSTNLKGAYGEFKGNENGDQDDQLYFDNTMWDGCKEGATEKQKKNTTLLMAVTLVHETAHWKWDVKHENGNWKNAEPGGEAGNQLERDLFGGIVAGGPDGLSVDGNALSDTVRDRWLKKDNWPAASAANRRVPLVAQTAEEEGESPIRMTLTLDDTSYELGDNILATVTYENVSASAVKVLTLNQLEGYPLWFEIVREGETERVAFRGARAKRIIDYENDFTTIQPGQTLDVETWLVRDPESGERRYNLIRSGDYQVTAFYSPHFGIPQTESDPVSFSVAAGGSVSGTVTHASTGAALEGAVVSAVQDGQELDNATTDAEGRYTIPELPGGTYTLEVSAPGFLRTSQEGVTVTAGQDTQQHFSLTPLLTAGQVQIVLTWGELPNDLDSHLWLPPTQPYHVYYNREGTTDGCPFSGLDVDDTDSFGPETITISQKVSGGQYVYYVHNFSGSPDLAGSGAQVEVFDSSGRIATFTAPDTGSGTYWHVFDLDGDTGAITEVNEITDAEPRPYLDTGAGCGDTPTVTFDSAEQSVGEADGTASVGVSLDFYWPLDITVPFTVGGTATEGSDQDYSLDPTGSVTIPAGQTSATITVTIHNDTAVEGDETVEISLGTPDQGSLGEPTQHVLTITDDD